MTAIEFQTMGAGRPRGSGSEVFDGARQVVRAEEVGYDGIVGPPSDCGERLSELIELGVDRFVIPRTPLDPDNPDSHAAERFFQEVTLMLRD